MDRRKWITALLVLTALMAGGCSNAAEEAAARRAAKKAKLEKKLAEIQKRIEAQNEPPEGVEAAIEVGSGPAGIAGGFGSVWVANQHGDSVSRIDPETNEVVSDIPIKGGEAARLAPGKDYMWLAVFGSNLVARIDPTTEEVKYFDAGGEMSSVPIEAFGSVWTNAGSELARLDVETGRIQATFPKVGGGIVATKTHVWAGSTNATVVAIDPASNRIVDKQKLPDWPAFLEGPARKGTVWGVGEKLSLVGFDPCSDKTYELGDPGNAGQFISQPMPAVTPSGDLYVGDGYKTLFKMNFKKMELEPFGPVPNGSLEIAYAYDAIWASSFSQGTVWKVPLNGQG